MHITEGMPVDLTDAEAGQVDAVVVEPGSWRVSHLVVRNGPGFPGPRLVQAARILHCHDRIQLSMSGEEFERCDRVQKLDDVVPRPPRPGAGWAVGGIRGTAWQAYGPASAFVGGCSGRTLIYDRIPTGRVELRRKSVVIDRDHRFVGHLDGLVVDEDLRVGALVVDKGHLWRHRRVTIPVGQLERPKTDVVRLKLASSTLRHELDRRRPALKAAAPAEGAPAELAGAAGPGMA